MNTDPSKEKLERHMEALKSMRDTQQRREYIEAVARAEGKFEANFLRDAFAQWWQTKPAKGTV